MLPLQLQVLPIVHLALKLVSTPPGMSIARAKPRAEYNLLIRDLGRGTTYSTKAQHFGGTMFYSSEQWAQFGATIVVATYS